MKIKKSFFSACLMAAVGSLGFGLSSCNNERANDVVAPNEGETYTITTESFFQQEDGTLVSFETLGLRAMDNEKGSITGAGSYFHNDNATITATPKTPYQLVTLYEKDGFGGNTYDKGKSTDGSAKTITVAVTKNLHFIAVFMGATQEKGYQNLKLAGRNSDISQGELSGRGTSSSVTAIGEEVTGMKDYTNKIIAWNVTNSSYKSWEKRNQSNGSDWLTVTPGDGVVNYTVKPYISKTGKARTATIQIGKNGTVTGAPSVWRTITFTQNSVWDGSQDDSTKPDAIVDGKGSAFAIPSANSYAFPTVGGQKNIEELLSGYNAKKPIYAVYYTYKNGVKGEEKKVEIKPSYSTKPAWLNLNGTTYSTSMNTTKNAKSGVVTVTWKAGAAVVGTTAVTFTQQPHKYDVTGEVK